MRRFPGSWTSTLTALGFRRVLRKAPKRICTLERLEERQMLSGVPVEENLLSTQTILVGAAVPDSAPLVELGQVALDESGSQALQPSYAFTASMDAKVSALFKLTTSYDISGAPELTIRYQGAQQAIAGKVQKLSLELKLGEFVMERAEIDVLVANPDFVSKLNADRLAYVQESVASVEAKDVQEVISGILKSAASPPEKPAVSLEELAQVAKSHIVSGDALADKNDRLKVYAELAAASNSLRDPDGTIDRSTQEYQNFGRTTVLLTATISADLKSLDPEVATAASLLRDQLFSTLGVDQTLFAGFGKNQDLYRDIDSASGIETALTVIEEATVSPVNGITVDLGGAPAMIQIARSRFSGYQPHVSAGVVVTGTREATADTSVQQAFPTSASGGSATTILAKGETNAAVRGYLKFDLGNDVGKVITTANLQLRTLTTDGIANKVVASKDLFGFTSGGTWDEASLTWNTQSNFSYGFSGQLGSS